MTDIKTLRMYRRKGIWISDKEKIRLCQDDTRRLRAFRKIVRKAAWIGAVASAVAIISLGGYMIRGYMALGAEIFIPAVALFACWIRREEIAEKEEEDSDR